MKFDTDVQGAQKINPFDLGAYLVFENCRINCQDVREVKLSYTIVTQNFETLFTFSFPVLIQIFAFFNVISVKLLLLLNRGN